MPSIDTLVEDIYSTLENGCEVSPEVAKVFGDNLAGVVIERLKQNRKSYLRLSNLGSRCLRRLWYSINTPELAEKLPGQAHLKFLIGDITEAVVVFLAKVSGHTVADEQQTVSVHGVEGHIDCTIDGEVTDVKSASPYSFQKFEAGLSPSQDAFGYLTQLGSYVQAKAPVHSETEVSGERRGHFLACDKVLGTLCLDSHTDLPSISSDYVQEVREILAKNEPPNRGFADEKFGESGNRALGVACSYCEFKRVCWPGVKGYKYSKGPFRSEIKWLTKVVKEPRVSPSE